MPQSTASMLAPSSNFTGFLGTASGVMLSLFLRLAEVSCTKILLKTVGNNLVFNSIGCVVTNLHEESRAQRSMCNSHVSANDDVSNTLRRQYLCSHGSKRAKTTPDFTRKLVVFVTGFGRVLPLKPVVL